MGNACGSGPPSVVISYQGREFECPECPRGALKTTRLFADYVRSELLLRDCIDRSASIRIYWTATGQEIRDADLKDLRLMRKRGIFVRAERSAAIDAARDNYRLEEKVSESFLHMLMDEAMRITEEGFGVGQTKDAAPPEFGQQSFAELVDTLQTAGASAQADNLMHEVRSAMAENLGMLNKAAILAQHSFELFPAVARGLSSKDSSYVAEAAASLKSHVEGISSTAAEATRSLSRLRETLHERQLEYKVGADARVCANSAGIAVCTAVPTADALVTQTALSEGPSAAAQSPFTSWLTSQHVHMQYWSTPGGLFSGSKVHSAAQMVFHFHVLSFITGGAAAVAALGGLGALLHYRCRRIGAWRRAAELVAPAADSLQAHEDHWRGLVFPCEQIARTLPQVAKEQNPASFNSMVAWKKVLKDTAILITAINAYFVWLDLAGWVPANFPLRSRLKQLSSSDPYDMMAQMIRQPRALRYRARPAMLALQAGGENGWEPATVSEVAAPLDVHQDMGDEEELLASRTPSEQQDDWHHEEHRQEDEEEGLQGDDDRCDSRGGGTEFEEDLGEPRAGANPFEEDFEEDDLGQEPCGASHCKEGCLSEAGTQEDEEEEESYEETFSPREHAAHNPFGPDGAAGPPTAPPRRHDPLFGGLQPHRRHAALAASRQT